MLFLRGDGPLYTHILFPYTHTDYSHLTCVHESYMPAALISQRVLDITAVNGPEVSHKQQNEFSHRQRFLFSVLLFPSAEVSV